MTQSEIYTLVGDEWRAREDIFLEYQSKFGKNTRKNFNECLNKLVSYFIECKYEGKKYWFRRKK